MPATRNSSVYHPSLTTDTGAGSSANASGHLSRSTPLDARVQVYSCHGPRKRLTLGDLECYRALGTGAFGQVVAVRTRPDTANASLPYDSTAHLALKAVNKIGIRDAEANPPNNNCVPRQARSAERRILSKLPWNPFFIGMIDAFVDERNIYYLLELAPGGSLADYINRCPSRVIPLDDAKFYFANIVLALEFLHSCGVVHLDIKPGNILMGGDGYLCLSDFGTAAEIDDTADWRVGTAEYSPPEVLAKKRLSNEARVLIDWWAAGVTLYEMVTGKGPFSGDESKLLSKIMSGRIMWYKSAQWVPELQDLLSRMLAPPPSERYGVQMHEGAPGQVPINHELRTHPWLRDLKWVSIAQRRELAPYVPMPVSDLSERYFGKRFPMEWMMPGLKRGQSEHRRVP